MLSDEPVVPLAGVTASHEALLAAEKLRGRPVLLKLIDCGVIAQPPGV